MRVITLSSPGHLAVCQLLVRAGCPLDEVTSAGLNGGPLHYAAGKGFLEADWSTSISRTVPRNCFASSLMP